jgi:hypothetical protein
MQMLIDFSLKEEGPIHQINKKWIWYQIKHGEGAEFFTESPCFNGGITLKKCNAYMEYKTILNGLKIIPDIVVLDSDNKLETVIECIDSSRPSFEKYQCYINSNINIIFVPIQDLNSLNLGKIKSELIVKKFRGRNFNENLMNERFEILFKHFSKLNYSTFYDYKYIGKFENDDTLFLFKKGPRGVGFFNSTDVNQDGDFSKGNSKKIPTFLKEYLKRFCLNQPDQIMNMKFNSFVPYEEYRRGVRKPIYKKIIYWSMN